MKKIINIILFLLKGINDELLSKIVFEIYREIATYSPVHVENAIYNAFVNVYGDNFMCDSICRRFKENERYTTILKTLHKLTWFEHEKFLLDEYIDLKKVNYKEILTLTFSEKINLFFGVVQNSVNFKLLLVLYLKIRRMSFCKEFAESVYVEEQFNHELATMLNTIHLFLIQGKLFDDRSHVLMHTHWQITLCARNLVRYQNSRDFIISLLVDRLSNYAKDDD